MSSADYYNFLTTPTGRYCELNEISNNEYLILLKFLQSGNTKGFFNYLDKKISESIYDFQDFNIIEKIYVYLVACMYSIRSSVKTMNKFIGDQDVPLTLILNNIEKAYVDKEIICKITENISITFGIPKLFNFDDEGNVEIDFLSNVKTVNGQKISKEDCEKLLSILKTKHLAQIETTIKNNLSEKFDIFEGVKMNSLVMPLYDNNLIMNVSNIFKMNLKSFYEMLYLCIHHVKMDYECFMKSTFVETDIILKICMKEKHEEQKRLNEGVENARNSVPS